jgi:anti-sigma regulatory factor (Ser/Thr protein kinase)
MGEPMSEPIETKLASGELSLAAKVEEDMVWRENIGPHLGWLPDNVQRICYHGFTEILNNAIDHSEGKKVYFLVRSLNENIQIIIKDDGVGIFEKIKTHFSLSDHRQAILELAKGKLTTDQARHTGEGIFFASRMFDKFMIMANDLLFSHGLGPDRDDWLTDLDLEMKSAMAILRSGTTVNMEIATNSRRTAKEVFDMFANPESDDYTFSKTHVPLRLAQYGTQQLISRSEAKRVLSRFEGFREVLLDFAGIDWIGQAFADEIFRVYRRNHPEINIIATNASEPVRQMINRVQAQAENPTEGPKAGGS